MVFECDWPSFLIVSYQAHAEFQAVNNSETLRLLASIELACYRCRLAVVDPRNHTKSRRRIERVIKEDRRRRHRRRKDQDAMIDAFQQHHLGDDVPES